jgi:hypothetical protein
MTLVATIPSIKPLEKRYTMKRKETKAEVTGADFILNG